MNKSLQHSRKRQQMKVILAFSIIPLVLLIVFTYLPFEAMVRYSFYDMTYTRIKKFVGLKNYVTIFTNKKYIAPLVTSLYYMVGAVVQVFLALYLATILSSAVKAKNLWRGLIFFPYLISGIAIGFIFKFYYTKGFVLDTVLSWFGVANTPYWLKDKAVNNWSLVYSSVWRYLGQNMVLFIGAIMSVDDTLYEAAEVDGANKWQQFWHIIMPSIKTIVTLNIILSITGSLSAFEAPFVITNGQNGTGTFFTTMNTIAHTNQKVGLASAMAVFLLVVILLCSGAQKLFFKFLYRNANTEDETYAAKKKRKKEMKSAKKEAV